MSVLDNRQLVFDRQAIRDSLVCNSRVAQHLRLPAHAADEVDLLPADQCVEIVHRPQESGGGPVIHRLNASQVAALLIAYCIQTRIPVPRNCKKGIVIGEASVVLTFANRITARG